MNITVLHGGGVRSFESNKSAINIISDIVSKLSSDANKNKKHKVTKIQIDEKGNWYENGVLSSPHRVLPLTDVLVDTTHNNSEADYKNLAFKLKVKNAFEDELHLDFVRKLADQLNIKTPSYKLVKNIQQDHYKTIKEEWRKLQTPILIKSAKRTVVTISSHNPQEIHENILNIHKRGEDCILDSCVQGNVYTIVAIKNFRGQKIYTSGILQLLKCGAKKECIRALGLTEKIKEEIRLDTQKVHKAINVPIAKYDFAYRNNKPVLLSVSTKPSFINDSILQSVFDSHSINFLEFLESLE